MGKIQLDWGWEAGLMAEYIFYKLLLKSTKIKRRK
jgi:hypothetical protein